jgi:hypothetical protein
MVNHCFDNLTNPELYPVLRTEPNDHAVWDDEIREFNQQISISETRVRQYNNTISDLTKQMMGATRKKRERILTNIEGINRKKVYEDEFQKRMRSYITQLECPTKWYNVRSYEAALVYIANGRAKLSPSYIPNMRDIPYNDNLDVFIYDWENKCWLYPSSYTVDTEIVDLIRVGEYDNYKTNKVLHSITISPTKGFTPSKKLLVYFAYNRSDIFDDIEMNEYKCNVRFKPILSLHEDADDAVDNDSDILNPYTDIKIRKHFDGKEIYKFEGFNNIKDFSIQKSFYIKRPKRSGKYTYSPSLRMCDVSMIKNNTQTYDFSQFDLYVRIPFADITTSQTFKTQQFDVVINQPIDSFVSNQHVNLICVQNNDIASYDGVISSITFEGITTTDGNIIITKTSLPTNVEGSFVCCINRDDMYKPCGGVITINVTITEEYLIDSMNNWIRIPHELSTYRELPDEFILVPRNTVAVSSDNDVTIILENKYNESCDDIINYSNDGTFNPFEYYFDSVNDIRYPLSNTRKNNYKERLVIDTTLNPDVKLIKSTYIGICRYSLQRIPKNGCIDVTGYISTPLSRKRYEFWVNGRCISNTKDLIILSPTSIQLCNMKSLCNFELIELVDDIDTSSVLREGNVYIDLNGKVYPSYKLALLSNANISKQDIRFLFNINQHTQLQDYTSHMISDPNNIDIEEDILSNIKVDSSTITDYDQLYNLPSINGVTIYHPTLSSLGIIETPSENILELFDEVWKYEIMTNPLFQYTHKSNNDSSNGDYVSLHVKDNDDDTFIVYATGVTSRYFTLYISKINNGEIDDVDNTVKIIPFIKTGTQVLINKSYTGMWLHSTHNNNPIEIK